MDIEMIASFSVISADPGADRRLFLDSLGLPLQPPESVQGSAYLFTESVDGAKHFGVWPLSEAADACFGQDTWPDTHPVPQASVEFEVGSAEGVSGAARELSERGYSLLHWPRTEPWGQVITRLQSSSGVIVGVCYTPWFHDG